ncbi:hypothetical protein EMIT047CA2_140108 [Pseudomonas soli]
MVIETPLPKGAGFFVAWTDAIARWRIF